MSIILLLGAVLVIVLMAAWIRIAHRSHLATLPGGATVELLGTSAGDETFTTSREWHRLARRYLPARFQNWLPAPISGSCGSGSNSLTVWLRIPGIARAAGAPLPWQGYVPEDETGFHYPRDGGFCTFSDIKGQPVCGLSLRAYPRRQREFLFHLLDQSGAAIATLHIPNPASGPFPVWQPAPAPQTQSNGPVTLTLLGWEQNENVPWPRPAPKWRLEATDRAWGNAKPRNKGFQDSTGNEGQFLSPRETAWKLRTLVYREGPVEFALNEQLVLTNLAVPAPANFLSIDHSADCVGVTLKVWVLAGQGIFGISNWTTRFMKPAPQGASGHSTSTGSFRRVDEWGSSTPFLLVEARNVQMDDDIQFRIHDNTGRELKVNSNTYDGLPSGSRLYKPSFTPSDASKFVNIRITVNRPLSFEFMVNPADIPQRKISSR